MTLLDGITYEYDCDLELGATDCPVCNGPVFPAALGWVTCLDCSLMMDVATERVFYLGTDALNTPLVSAPEPSLSLAPCGCPEFTDCEHVIKVSPSELAACENKRPVKPASLFTGPVNARRK